VENPYTGKSLSLKSVSPKLDRYLIFINTKYFFMSDVTLTAYNVKTKEKNVPMMDAIITKTAKGAYMAQGNDGKGNKLTTLLGQQKALDAIKAGIAKQGW